YYTVMVTARSVNSRYLDFRFKAPSICAYMEPLVRQLIKKLLARGKVELGLSITRDPEAEETSLQADLGLARAYKNIFTQLQQDLGLELTDIPLSLIVGQPEVLLKNRIDSKAVSNYTDQYLLVIEKALRSLRLMQEAEGEVLQADLLMRCQKLESLMEEISHLVQGLPELIRDKLVVRIKSLLAGLAPIDDSRVYQ
ncbi:MAG: hypothetical protein KAW01_06450, partial [Deltaproteobacteria bacterium]|nr:hypothetical protein [Deltaproteobacteria bacterium]